MIDIQLSTNRKFADLVQGVEREAPQRVYRGVTRYIIPPIERVFDRVVRTEPAERNAGSPKFIWSTNPIAQRKAQKWFFAHYPEGYTRTHQMVKAWEISIEFADGVITLSVFNPSPGAFFVFGDEEHDPIPGHKTTGWRPIADTLVDIGAETEDAVAPLWGDTVEELM